MEQAQPKLKQPKVLYLSTVSAMSERFGYYIISFLIVLIAKDVYRMSDEVAFELCAIFTALGYLTPAIGGFMADKLVGIRRCWGLGLIAELIGFILLSAPTDDKYVFALALGCIIIGAGIFKTTPTNLLGRAYKEKDPRIDSGFTLFYMGINLGSFTSSIVAGPIKEAFGWTWGPTFMVASIGLLAGFVWFVFFKHLGNEFETELDKKHFPLYKWLIVIVCCVISVIATAFMLIHLTIGEYCFYILSALILAVLFWQIIISPKEEKIKIIVCLALIFLAIGFFILYMQMFQSVVLFLERNVDRRIFTYNVPIPVFLGMNAVAIIGLSPLVALFYTFLEKRNKRMLITTKFPVGLILIGISYAILYFASFTGGPDGKISILWMILYVILYSLAELLISALGVAMITRIAPERIYGLMMGAWFFIATGLSSALSGTVGSWARIPPEIASKPLETLPIYGVAYLKMGMIGFAFAIVGFIIAPWLKKHGKLGS